MDEHHLMAAVRYVELNPVRARLCNNPQDWPWSSAGAHLNNKDDSLVTVAPMLQRVGNWNDYLETAESTASLKRIRQHSLTGRPAGNNRFINQLELLSGRELHRKKPGPKAIAK
jgi:putative transposase